MIRRRDFITLLGGAAAAWPLAARAQQPALPVVGYLSLNTIELAGPIVAAFRKGLSEAGFVDGRNVSIQFQAANNDPSRVAELAANMVRQRVDVILASGGAASARAAKIATASIPIVFNMGDDPVAVGVVASLNRPGGNITGVSFLSSELGPKRLGLLKELVPEAMLYALLANPNALNSESMTAELRAAATGIGRKMEVFTATNAQEIDHGFSEMVRRGAHALVVSSSSLFVERRAQIATLAAYHRLPAIYYDRRTTEVGGLMSYGASIADAQRQAGVYVGRILKGEKPADLPVVQSAKFEFIMNLQTAKTLGLSVPQTLLATADEVIE
jgi:putative ABC transport system substrate-binding protein